MSADKSQEELLRLARRMLQAELIESLDRLKEQHQDSLVVQIAAKPLLEWLRQLEVAELKLRGLVKQEESQLMLAEFLLVVSKPALYDQADLGDLQKRAGKLLKEMQA